MSNWNKLTRSNDGTWYFYAEDIEDIIGPYPSREVALRALRVYEDKDYDPQYKDWKNVLFWQEDVSVCKGFPDCCYPKPEYGMWWNSD
jgi:hypothetical protein